MIEGVWGLFSNVVFGVLTTNIVHAVIHIILGITGLILGIKQNAKGFCIFLGLLLLVVGIFRFVPGVDVLIVKIFNVNHAVAYLNIIVGMLSLLVAINGKKNVPEG